MSSTDKGPIFVVSAPRSGSTLFRMILDAHPAIAVPPPAWLYELIRPYLYSYGSPMTEDGFKAMCHDIVDTPTISAWELGISAEVLADGAATKDFKGAFAFLHRLYADNTGKVRWGEKSPRDSFWMGEILADFPDAKFVHIVRDGRDMAIDIADSPKMRPFGMLLGAHIWKMFVSAIRESASRLDDKSFFEIKYEALCADPGTELKKVCDFLGEDYDAAMLSHHTSRQAVSWASDPQHAKSGQPISTDFCEIYKKRLSKRDAGYLESVFSDLMEIYDYPLLGPVEIPARLAGQLYQSDIVTAPANYEHKSRLLERRKERLENGVYRLEDRESILRSPV